MENKTEQGKFTYTTQGTQRISELRKHLQEVLGELIKYNKEFENKEMGLKASVTQKDINKISSKEAIRKSKESNYTKEEHFKVAENIGQLYENATLKETHADYKGSPNIANVHRFNIDIEVNDKETIAKITMFERIEGKNRLYTIELQGLNPPLESSCVQETGMAKSTQLVGTPAHTEMPLIADFDEKIIPNLQTKSQGANSKDEKIKALKDEAKKISEKNKNKDLDNDDKRVDR